MLSLLAAVVLHFTLHGGTKLSHKLSVRRWVRPVACLSLGLWMAVLIGARWIATY
jgi:hypothetical protein